MPHPPFIESKPPPVSGVLLVSGSDTRAIDHLRQGVEITDPRMRLLGTLPKISAGTEDHSLVETTFGQPREFRSDTPFLDMPKLDPATLLDAPSSLMAYPLTGRNPSYSDTQFLDGAIEPLAIRSRAAVSSIDWPYEAHDVAGQVMGGNEDPLRKADSVVSELAFPHEVSADPFTDAAESMGSSPSSSIVMPGFHSDNERTLASFSDTRHPSMVTGSLGSILFQAVLSSSAGVSGTHPQDPGYMGPGRVSSTKGIEFQSSRRMGRQWTDSLAFGDRESYMSRGFLALRDAATGSYPTIVRTSQDGRKGDYVSWFDDRHTIEFNEDVSLDVGRNLSVGSVFRTAEHLSSSYVRNHAQGTSYPFVGQRSVVTPSAWPIITQGSGTVRAGVSDANVSFTPGESMGPFDDSAVAVDMSAASGALDPDGFFVTGSSPNTFPGFGSRLIDKTQIRIDLTPASEKSLYRVSTARIAVQGGASPEFSVGSTGFAYFNHIDRRWEDVGLRDQVTGDVIPYDYCVTIASGAVTPGGYAATGTGNFPCQFSMSPQLVATGNPFGPIISSNAEAFNFGYDKIGTPTNACFAPFATKYHATASQVLRLSSYIKSPFLLEAAVVRLPIVVRRVHHSDANLPGSRSDNAQRRDMDNYVFFIYRQNRMSDPSGGADSLADVSGSVRSLLCSASMTFWNSPTVLTGYSYAAPGTIPASDVNLWPLHKPAFSHDWNIAVNGTSSLHRTGTDDYVAAFTGTVVLHMRPALCQPQYFGASAFPGQLRTGSIDIPIVVETQNSWVGASTQSPFMELGSGFTGKRGISASLAVLTVAGYDAYRTLRYSVFDPGSASVEAAGRTLLPDSRFMRSIPWGVSTANPQHLTFGTSTTIGSVQSQEIPCVLMPEDELVFGLDAGISQFRNGASIGLTGSVFKVLAQQASITLFGSLIRAGAEHHDTLNQHLTSMTVHEAMGTLPVTDQFEVERPELYSGSYIDDVVDGVMSRGVPTRGLVASAVAPSGSNRPGMTGSLLRASVSTDYTERFYDTVMPDIAMYLSGSGELTSSLPGFMELDDGSIQVRMSPLVYFVETGSMRMPFPYDNDYPRRDGTARVKLIGNDGSGAYFSTGSTLRRLLFKFADRGRQDIAGLIGTYDHADRGAMGFKYGIYNTEPRMTRAVFRMGRYGQFRDMLEQRCDSKFQRSVGGIVGTTTVQGPVFVTFSGSSPYVTSGSNMSSEATSSLPYFDGVSRNR